MGKRSVSFGSSLEPDTFSWTAAVEVAEPEPRVRARGQDWKVSIPNAIVATLNLFTGRTSAPNKARIRAPALCGRKSNYEVTWRSIASSKARNLLTCWRRRPTEFGLMIESQNRQDAWRQNLRQSALACRRGDRTGAILLRCLCRLVALSDVSLQCQCLVALGGEADIPRAPRAVRCVENDPKRK